MNISTDRTPNINIGLGLPESSSERITNQGSTGSAARDAIVDPQITNPIRRTTLPDDNTSQRINITPNDNNVDIPQ